MASRDQNQFLGAKVMKALRLTVFSLSLCVASATSAANIDCVQSGLFDAPSTWANRNDPGPPNTSTNNSISFDQWQAPSDQDGDFRFRNPASAAAIGFSRGACTNAGLTGPPEWTKLPDLFDRPTAYEADKEAWPGRDFS